MGKEEDAAVLAAIQATPQMWMGSQCRPQDDIILKDEIADLASTIPVRPKFKIPRNLYGKKPRLSLMTLIWPDCLVAAALVTCIRA